MGKEKQKAKIKCKKHFNFLSLFFRIRIFKVRFVPIKKTLSVNKQKTKCNKLKVK